MGDDIADTPVDYVVGDVNEGESQAGSNNCCEVSHSSMFEGRDEHASKNEFFKDCRTKNDRRKEEDDIPWVGEMRWSENKTCV